PRSRISSSSCSPDRGSSPCGARRTCCSASGASSPRASSRRSTPHSSRPGSSPWSPCRRETEMLTLQLALRNLMQARRRTFLLGTAIGLVTVLLVGMLSWAHGIEDNLVREATTLSAGHVVLAGFTKTNPKEAAPIVSDKETLKKIVQENTPGLDYVI